MPEASTKTINLTQAAGHVFAPPEVRDELIALEDDGAAINSSFKTETQHEEKEKKDEDDQKRNYVSAVAASNNIALRIGSFVFSTLQVSGALDQWSGDQQEQLELLKRMDEANQSIYQRHEDGSLFTQQEIDSYEDQNRVCVANPHEMAAAIASQENNVNAAAAAEAALDSGEPVDLNALPKEVADKLVTDKIQEQIANGETVDLSTIPPEFKDVAINAIIGTEIDDASKVAYTKAGLTEEQYRQGGLLYDKDARAVYNNEMDTWEQGRRAELSAQAGVDYEPPEPTADASTAAPSQDADKTLDVNDPNTFTPPTAGM